MNAELYLPKDGKVFAKTSDDAFEESVKLLSDIDINIIYKTEINMTKASVTEALRETKSGEDKIDLVIIADALNSDSSEDAAKLFEKLGINEKIKTIEARTVSSKDDISKNKKNIAKEQEDDIIIESSPALIIDEDEKEVTLNINETVDKTDVVSEDNKDTDKGKVNLKSDGHSEETAFNENKENGRGENKKSDTIYAFSAEHDGILIMLLPTEEAAGKDFETILYSVCSSALNPKKKKNAFWRRIIPCSGDTPFDVIRKVILMVAVITFIVSSSMLVNILVIRPAINDNTTGSIRELLVSSTETDEEGNEITKKPTDGSQGTLVDFSKLLDENKDTVGWIKIPNTRIDYVVVQPPETEDPEYYLYKDFYGNYDAYGTVFMDYRSKLDSKNMILHGHHMQDGRMFANLLNYEDYSFYKKTPSFTFNTIYEKSEWKIISVLKTNTLEEHGRFFNYLRGDFDNDYDFLNFVYQVRERSLYDCPVDVNENDTLVTLSTCTYDFSEFRFVVVARKVRDGESSKVDVSKARVNPDTLYPDVWYNVRGGVKPDVTTFQDAFNNGKIDWYDGKNSKWSEKDDKNLEKTLNEGKKNALKELDEYLASRNYLSAEKKKIDQIMAKYKDLINDAASGKEINKLYAEAYKELAKVKTKEQISKEQEESDKETSAKELQSSKVSAKASVKDSIAGNKYYRAERTKVEDLLREYYNKIDSAKTIEAVEQFKKDGIAEIAKIKTSDEKDEESEASRNSSSKPEQSSKPAQSSKPEQTKPSEPEREPEQTKPNEPEREPEQTKPSEPEQTKPSEPEVVESSVDTDAERLEEEKGNAINTIYNYLDIDMYYENQQVEIYTIYQKYEDLINGSASSEEINGYVDSALRELDTILTSAEIDAQSSTEEQTSDEGE